MIFMYDYKMKIVLYVLLAIFGASFIFIPTETLLGFIFSTLGILIVLFNIVPCVTYINASLQNKEYVLPAISYSLFVLFGLMFIFGWSNLIISIIFSVILIILPIIRIIISKNKKEDFKKELPYIVVGALLFFIPFTNIIGIIIKVFGALVVLYSIYMIVLLLINKNNNNNNNKTKKKKDDSVVIDAKIKEL